MMLNIFLYVYFPSIYLLWWFVCSYLLLIELFAFLLLSFNSFLFRGIQAASEDTEHISSHVHNKLRAINRIIFLWKELENWVNSTSTPKDKRDTLRWVGEAKTWPHPWPYPRYSDHTIRRGLQNMWFSLEEWRNYVPLAPGRQAPKIPGFKIQCGLRSKES